MSPCVFFQAKIQDQMMVVLPSNISGSLNKETIMEENRYEGGLGAAQIMGSTSSWTLSMPWLATVGTGLSQEERIELDTSLQFSTKSGAHMSFSAMLFKQPQFRVAY